MTPPPPDAVPDGVVPVVEELLQAIVARIIGPQVGARSRWALNAAADAAGTEGIAGCLVVQIPSHCSDYVDVIFTIGTVEMVSRWGLAG